MPGDKSVQPVQRALFLKYLCKTGQRVWRCIDARTPAFCKLQTVQMGRAVRSQKHIANA